MAGFANVKKMRGAAMLELALLSPWIIFLFIGVLDFGFYAYSLISIENAARAAVINNVTAGTPNDSGAACTIVLYELSSLSNMNGVSGCGVSGSPVSVAAATVSPGPDGSDAAKVSVTYTTPTVIPIPGLLRGQYTFTRSVTMRQ